MIIATYTESRKLPATLAIAFAGGGPAALVAAIALACRGARVTVLGLDGL